MGFVESIATAMASSPELSIAIVYALSFVQYVAIFGWIIGFIVSIIAIIGGGIIGLILLLEDDVRGALSIAFVAIVIFFIGIGLMAWSDNFVSIKGLLGG